MIELEAFEKESIKIMENDKNIIAIGLKIDKNYIDINNVYKIYIDIILALIKKNKLKDCENLFNQIDIKFITINLLLKIKQLMKMKFHY